MSWIHAGDDWREFYDEVYDHPPEGYEDEPEEEDEAEDR